MKMPRLFKMNKKGQVLENFKQIFVALASITIAVAVSFLIVAQANDQAGGVESLDFANATQCAQSHTCNATTSLQTSLSDAVDWIDLAVIVLVGVVLIGAIGLIRSRR